MRRHMWAHTLSSPAPSCTRARRARSCRTPCLHWRGNTSLRPVIQCCWWFSASMSMSHTFKHAYEHQSPAVIRALGSPVPEMGPRTLAWTCSSRRRHLSHSTVCCAVVLQEVLPVLRRQGQEGLGEAGPGYPEGGEDVKSMLPTSACSAPSQLCSASITNPPPPP